MLSRLPWSPKPEIKPRAFKLSKDRRRTLADQVADILRDGQPTRFAFEGACRHGLRSGLVLDGWPWPLADLAAADVVSRALNQLGAVRPTWLQAQPEYTADGFSPIERTRCVRCGGRIPDGRGSRNGVPVLYCSNLCNVGAGARRARLSGEQVSWAERLAVHAVRRERTLSIEKPCAHCGRAFRPGYNIHRQQFCSRACADAGKPRPRRLPKRACVGCGALFKPKLATNKYCSPACYQGRGASPYRGEERTCPVCQGIFRVHSPTMPQVTCSRKCGWMLRRAARFGVNDFQCDAAE